MRAMVEGSTFLCNRVSVAIMAAQIKPEYQVDAPFKIAKGSRCAGRWTRHSVVYHTGRACPRETRPCVCGERLPVP